LQCKLDVSCYYIDCISNCETINHCSPFKFKASRRKGKSVM